MSGNAAAPLGGGSVGMPAAPSVTAANAAYPVQMPVRPFTGEVEGSVDAKGRVCIPVDFRVRLAQLGTPGIYFSPCYYLDAVDGFGVDVLNACTEKYYARAQQSGRDPAADVVFAKIAPAQFDENGRVRLPESLISYAGLKRKVIFAGRGDRFRIWDAERYQAYQAEQTAKMMKACRARMEKAEAEDGFDEGLLP